jgi:hypothetical protein
VSDLRSLKLISESHAAVHSKDIRAVLRAQCVLPEALRNVEATCAAKIEPVFLDCTDAVTLL